MIISKIKIGGISNAKDTVFHQAVGFINIR